MAKRGHISFKTKLAAALCHMLREDAQGVLVRVIPHEDAKRMTADQIISLFNFDHDPIPKAHDGPDEPWNLPPKFIVAHRRKTASVDVPMIAKTKRVSAEHEEFRRRILAKEPGQPSARPKSRIQSRGFQQQRARP